MKIHPDQLESVRLDQTTQTGRAAQSSTAFGDILTQEVGKSGATGASTAATLPPPGGLGALSALVGMQEVEATDPAQATAVMDSVGGVLDRLDQYAQSLAGSSGSLKEAYGALDGIDGAVRQIKADNPDLATRHPELHGLVSELEALSVTERVKFNRGDYTA